MLHAEDEGLFLHSATEVATLPPAHSAMLLKEQAKPLVTISTLLRCICVRHARVY
jgi:hypothetical protein